MKPHIPLYQTVPLWREQFAMLQKVAANLEQQTPDVIAAAALAYLASFPDRKSLVEGMSEALERYGRRGKPLKLQARFDWPDLPRAYRSFNSSQL